MIAKATASEAQTRFINLDVSILTDKWYGESQKLATAVFTLAVKLQPCIVFIDEIGKLMCFDMNVTYSYSRECTELYNFMNAFIGTYLFSQ
jgi:ATP-dependent 26S proteasome regulatory subunit